MSDHIAVEAAQTTGRCCGGTAAVPADRQALGLVTPAEQAATGNGKTGAPPMVAIGAGRSAWWRRHTWRSASRASSCWRPTYGYPAEFRADAVALVRSSAGVESHHSAFGVKRLCVVLGLSSE
jgi:hypothetical protein